MKHINRGEQDDLRVAIRQFRPASSTALPEYVMEAGEPTLFQEKTKVKVRKLNVINESMYEDEDAYVPHVSLQQIETRISNASCHKKRRGLLKRMTKMQTTMEQLRDTRGLLRCKMRTQNDTGATHCITDNKAILHKFRNITPLPISGIASNNTALHATGVGMITMTSEEGDKIIVECLYSPDAEGTLISPTAITSQYNEIFEGWTLFANTTNKSGYMKLIHNDGLNHATFPMYCEDNLWYHYLPSDDIKEIDQASIRRLSTLSEYTLWHHRLGHPNDTVLGKMHQFARGVPKLRTPDFYKCQTCSLGKIKKDASTKTKASLPTPAPTPKETIHPGQHLHADFGFVRGSAFSKIDEQGRLITSKDGFRSYLIVVDRATRYKWVFLTTTRHPPLKELRTILEKHKLI